MTNKKLLSYIIHFLKPYKLDSCIVMLSILGVSGAILGLGKAIKFLMDRGIALGNAESLNQAIIYIIALTFVLGIASFLRSYFINSLSEKVIKDIRQKVYSHLLTLQFRQFEIIKDSDIVSRLFSDIDLISRIIVDIFSFCLRNGVLFCGGIFLMFSESVKLSLIVLIVIPIALLIISSVGRKVRILARENQANLATISEYVSETFRGIKTIYAANAQENKKNDFLVRLSGGLDIALQRLYLRAIFFAASITTMMGLITFVIWLGSQDVLNHKMSSGQLFAFIIYAFYSGISIGGIFEVFGDTQRYLAGAERVFTLLEIDDAEIGESSPIFNLKANPIIKFDNVSFVYPSRPENEVLREISFEVKIGETIGIIGVSGSGKSTILQLLVKFFNISRGRVLAFDKDCATIFAADLRSKIALVSQDPFMFTGTIKNNILLTNSNCDLKSILSTVGLVDFIDTLPNGLDTYIGSSGAQLSGGQKQRIAIARALCSNPEILLLDESTNALDQESEKNIIQEIRKLMPDKTIILVTHRMTSIEKVDRIMVMDSGKIVDIGSHEQLANRCALYQRLRSAEV